MNKTILTITFLISCNFIIAQTSILSPEEMKSDFMQMRELLENKHWDLYFYTPREKMDSLFDASYRLIKDTLPVNEFFKLLTPIIANTGCGHTGIWMPSSFWRSGNDKFFPLQIRLFNNQTYVSGSYTKELQLPVGAEILEINNRPVKDIVEEMKANYPSAGLREQGKIASVERRFPMIYLRRYGYQDNYTVSYRLPGKRKSYIKELNPATQPEVRRVVFKLDFTPELSLKYIEEGSIAVLTVNTFSYYNRVDYFKSFLDSVFTDIKTRKTAKLILDLRGNNGGDPNCSAPLLSYLEKEPQVYFARASRAYAHITNKPIQLAENSFNGILIIFMDRSCFSTNGHFCSLLKYHRLGTIIGTPSSGNYICSNSKRIDLEHSGIMLYHGTRGYATAVEMDRRYPIYPDIYINETIGSLTDGKDLYLEKAIELLSPGIN